MQTADSLDTDFDLGTRRATGHWVGLLQVVGAWLVGRMVVTSDSPVPFFSFKPADWFRWDSFNYLSISQSGRTFGLCGTHGFPRAAVQSARWCGTAGWLPGYPYAVKLVSYVGIHPLTTGLVVPSLSLLGTLGILWYGWTRKLPPWRSFLVLVLFGVFPGAIYNYAEYPTALALLGIVTAIFAASRQRNAIVALGVAVAVISYSSATFAALGLILAMVVAGWSQGWNEVLKRAAWGCVGFSPLALLALHDQLAFHHWSAYWLLQNESHKALGGLPGAQLYELIVLRNTNTQILIGHNGAIVMAMQALLSIAIVLAASFMGFRRWWRSGRSTLDLYPAAVGLTAILIMANSGTGSIWHRGIVLAAPSVVGFRYLPTWALAVLLAATALVTALISTYFFKNTLG